MLGKKSAYSLALSLVFDSVEDRNDGKLTHPPKNPKMDERGTVGKRGT